eukprot:CAMPEP_0174588524 /NCGR_PEP_ID=MMETSP0929-20130131/34618_1 /TAXON_ID=548131 ORGANISM="Ostreococcus mediterraneus, Strain clade-D-RCC2572" /NCGR_SAMPLE_ID=MMETSP0929 /ASSEMBLY_ACC=CAM_ASM_000573 /LENGTH=424 /DNA_ID=CAMNT_0015770643 /DNA_START=451 /DNA_END=1725 /DNA_ORIENTATION=+
MDEKRHDGCDGRDHDAPFTNKTHACFVSTCYITRIAGDPRMNVNVRVHDSYKMATVTTCARGALEFFVQIISSSIGTGARYRRSSIRKLFVTFPAFVTISLLTTGFIWRTSRLVDENWLVCSSSAALPDNGTLHIHTPKTGRTGNHIRFYRWALTEALSKSCHVVLPQRISTLEFQSSCNAFLNTRANVDADCGQRYTIDDYSGSRFKYLSSALSNHVYAALRQYTSSREITKKRRYAYGRPCPQRGYSMIQIRSGDTYRGTFSTGGDWQPARTYAQYAPFPTSYYVHAFTILLNSGRPVVVVCEDVLSLACSFFLKLEVVFPKQLQVRLSGSLMEDLWYFTCSAHVVASRGSFHESFNLHASQILHDFSDVQVHSCIGNKIMHFMVQNANLYAQNVTHVWKNNDLQRSLVDTAFKIDHIVCAM